jgi:hypothetical protein
MSPVPRLTRALLSGPDVPAGRGSDFKDHPCSFCQESGRVRDFWISNGFYSMRFNLHRRCAILLGKRLLDIG